MKINERKKGRERWKERGRKGWKEGEMKEGRREGREKRERMPKDDL